MKKKKVYFTKNKLSLYKLILLEELNIKKIEKNNEEKGGTN
jgi:hypothetical protein